jgi:hypothetical protein
VRAGRRCRGAGTTAERDVLGRLDEFTRRLSLCVDYGEASQSALEALEDLFGFTQSILLLRDDVGDRLFAVTSNGYAQPAAGAEIPLGSGLIGVAAQRRQVVCVPNVARGRVMQDALRAKVEQAGATAAGPEIPLPGLEEPHSMAAVPLVVQGDVAGVLFLESERIGLFGPHQERLLRTVGACLAAALRALDAGEPEPAAGPVQRPSPPQRRDPLRLTYYQADDSVFVDGAYLAKGVPGRILWRLARIHASEGRDTSPTGSSAWTRASACRRQTTTSRHGCWSSASDWRVDGTGARSNASVEDASSCVSPARWSSPRCRRPVRCGPPMRHPHPTSDLLRSA